MTPDQEHHISVLALSAFVSLAVFMGIGRFAFTPLLPMMQADAGVTLAFGGWLASANYLGYLCGALVAAALPGKTTTQLRASLALVVASTAVMGMTDNEWAWLVLRFLAGLASAIGLVSTTALCLAQLNAAGASRKAGILFAGVGGGIALAGLLCLALVLSGVSSAGAWVIMGMTALLGAFLVRSLWADPSENEVATPNPLATSQAATAAAASGAEARHAGVSAKRSEDIAPGAPGETAPHILQAADAASGVNSADRGPVAGPPGARVSMAAAHPEATPGGRLRLILCYCTFGFGYILPATFLPAQARQLIADPGLFGLAWPIFGLAAVASTLFVSYRAGGWSRRHIWMAAQIIMAVGVLLPAFWHSLAAIVLAALCVGGTFMVMTMAGMQEAQALGGPQPRKFLAVITASFAVGQLAGPVVFSLMHDYLGVSLDGALILAGGILLAGCTLLIKPFAQ